MLTVARRRPSASLAWATWTSRWVSTPTVTRGRCSCAMVVMPSPFCDQAVDGTRRRAGGQHCNGSGATGSYQVTVARWRCPWRPQREPTGLATRHKASGTTGQTLATTTTARSLQWNKIEHRLFGQITMNWRGRPLTSHEVVVNTSGSTRTRTGLRVEAELDRGAYPTGVGVSKAHLAGLPIQPHATHGAWNYTISPAAGPPSPQAGTSGPPAAARRAAMLRILAHPRLTGMPRQELDALAGRLAPAQAAAREQRCYQQRGGPRRQTPGAHGQPILSDRDRLLVAVVYLRQVCSQQVLADLLGVTQPVIGPAVKETRRLLAEQQHTITPTALRLGCPQDVLDYAHTGNARTDPARLRRHQQLADPALTGMPRADLDLLVERLSIRQAALVERRRHQRRGGDRLAGTRRGIFQQKITDPERVLATVLHLRQVCTQGALADLFDVSRGTIRNAIDDVLPLLEEDGFQLPPSPVRLRTKAEVLTFITAHDTASAASKPPA